MYKTILLTLDASPADKPIIDHVGELAARLESRVVLLHVVTAAQAQFLGADAGGETVHETQEYLEQVRRGFEARGTAVSVELAYGEPAREIVRWVETHECDLVAMGTHGHRWLSDMVLGFTASRVQHAVKVPVLLLRRS